jgi:hypothetical protein
METMKSTKDYSLFKDICSNREIDSKHVNKLIRAIESNNLLHVNPIIVDDQMRVIDGQHRLEAAKKLKLEIFYIKAGVSRKDISVLNSNQKNWTGMDYINFYTIEKVDSFVQFSNLVNTFPDMSISALLVLSNSEGRRDIQQLKAGYLDVLNIHEAKEICLLCKWLFEKYNTDFVFDSRFPIALMKLMNTENFDLDNLKEKIEGNPRAFVPCHTIKEYLNMLVEIYNYKMSKNAIKLK